MGKTLAEQIREAKKPHNYIELTEVELDNKFSRSYIEKCIYGTRDNYIILDACMRVIKKWQNAEKKLNYDIKMLKK